MKRGSEMKKFQRLLVLLPLALCLCSCRVNWFGRQYDAPWWMIAIPTVLILASAWFFVGRAIAKREYKCSECQKTFYPTWWKASFSVHMGSDRVFKCPHCGKKGFCKLKKD